MSYELQMATFFFSLSQCGIISRLFTRHGLTRFTRRSARQEERRENGNCMQHATYATDKLAQLQPVPRKAAEAGILKVRGVLKTL